jgi:hypothetical protein
MDPQWNRLATACVVPARTGPGADQSRKSPSRQLDDQRATRSYDELSGKVCFDYDAA